MVGSVSLIVLLWAAAGLILTLGGWLFLRALRRRQDRERLRRGTVYREGRMGEALVTDARDGIVYYQYEVRGVVYAASQDVSALVDRLPSDLTQVIGHGALKYLPRNPANSITVCEEWSGLRIRQPVPGNLENEESELASS
ncbi:MAG: hypothetical protein IPM24_11530 [Bryobacterales bacterium]|jgi:hypothetical protein|nr:hypothetical protein [Bryobacterales bacterium]